MGSMIQFTIQTAEWLELDYEVTIVDDGSESHTLDLLDDIQERFPKVNIHRHEHNKGYGGALRTGFSSGTKEWIFYTDGDCQYDVREMKVLMEHARDGVDIIQGYKITRNDPIHRIIIGRMYHWLVKLSFGLKIRDTDCDFRMIRRSVFDKVILKEDSGVICAELMTKSYREGCIIEEVPVHHFERAHGKSQFFNFPRIAKVIWRLYSLWIRDFLHYRLGIGEKP
jgi:glycosyltransferase involved in cell wall biosynthesis